MTAVLVENIAHTRVLTLNRPDSFNAIDPALATRLGDELSSADLDPEVRAIVITGSGDRAFCAGMDLKAFAAGLSSVHPAHPEWGFGGFARHRLRKPLISAVNGVALGGGGELVLASDLAIAAESSRFGFPEVTRGLIAGAGGVVRLARQIPEKLANELLFTGRFLTAEEALRFGLVNEIVPDGAALERAVEIAQLISRNSPIAVQATKSLARSSREFASDWSDELWEAHDLVMARVFSAPDAVEGANAFAQKRPPVWANDNWSEDRA